MRDSIFVSYSHADRAMFDELRDVLAALPESVQIAVWDDTRISPSSHWRREIDEALNTSAAAVLLVSSSFLSSTFIVDHELPAFRAAADRGELRLFPMVLDACAHGTITDAVQAVNDPAKPMASLTPDARREIWTRLSHALRDVAAEISEEQRIGAECLRLQNDMQGAADVVKYDQLIAQARVDPDLNGDELKRESAVASLEGKLCRAAAGWLSEEQRRPDVSPVREKAIGRMLQAVAIASANAERRFTEIVRRTSEDTLAALNRAKDGNT